MSKRKDISGERFGRLVASCYLKYNGTQSYWFCKCDCGKEVKAGLQSLQSGLIKSCGCLKLESVSTHRESNRGVKEYETWRSMRQRCLNNNHKYYDNYGGRGIKICDRWKNSYEHFLEDMGRAPTKKHSLDRIDNDGNYEPTNCRWSTQQIQCNNKRTCVYIELNGDVMTISELARKLNIKRGRVNYYIIKKGMKIDDFIKQESISKL